jgi:hypothetical protein
MYDICLETLKPMGKLYYEINSSYCRLRNPCITLFPMNVHKVSKDVLKMEQVKNEIFATDSISALVADFSVTSSSKQILMMVC